MPIYGSPSFELGDDAAPAATSPVTAAVAQAAAAAPITKDTAAKAKRELARMKRSLTNWLKYRAINDKIAAGSSVPSPLLKYPLASPPPAPVMVLNLSRIRQNEDALAQQLYALLSEVMDPTTLPSPSAPNAAAALAQIAIAGKVPGDTTPTPTGSAWLWPAVVVVGGVVLVLTTLIRSNADQQMEQERLQCVQSGACTDSGFWLKVGAVAVVGWIVWEKFGVGRHVSRAVKGGRRR